MPRSTTKKDLEPMTLRRRSFSVLAAIQLTVVCGCTPDAAPAINQGNGPADDKAVPTIYAVNDPMAWLARRLIDPQRVTVRSPPEEAGPAWSPDADTVRRLQSAELILLSGGKFAAWADRVSLPRRAVFNVGDRIQVPWIPLADARRHQHGPNGALRAGPVATHWWLDMGLMQQAAKVLEQELIRRGLTTEQEIAPRQAALQQELQSIGSALAAACRQSAHVDWIDDKQVFAYLLSAYSEASESPADSEGIRITLQTTGGPPGPETKLLHDGLQETEGADFGDLMRQNAERLRLPLTQ